MKIWNSMNGSKMMFYRASTCLWILICSTSSSFAEEKNNSDSVPSMAFLEYLGEWGTDDDDWIDPEDLDNDDIGKLIEVIRETDNEQ
ncbi:MAG: hypothetical protein ACI85N_001492 [Gammaproteobacteria bacterium]|jgi:hypothetical protein